MAERDGFPRRQACNAGIGGWGIPDTAVVFMGSKDRISSIRNVAD